MTQRVSKKPSLLFFFLRKRDANISSRFVSFDSLPLHDDCRVLNFRVKQQQLKYGRVTIEDRMIMTPESSLIDHSANFV